MDDKKFRQILGMLRLMELEDHGRIGVVRFDDMDLTEEQKKIINDEFFKNRRAMQRTEPTYFTTLGF